MCIKARATLCKRKQMIFSFLKLLKSRLDEILLYYDKQNKSRYTPLQQIRPHHPRGRQICPEYQLLAFDHFRWRDEPPFWFLFFTMSEQKVYKFFIWHKETSSIVNNVISSACLQHSFTVCNLTIWIFAPLMPNHTNFSFFNI